MSEDYDRALYRAEKKRRMAEGKRVLPSKRLSLKLRWRRLDAVRSRDVPRYMRDALALYNAAKKLPLSAFMEDAT